MNAYRFLIGFIGILSVSCVKEEVTLPSFDTQESHVTVHAGDSLQFQFNGDANVVTFYSGEPGHVYIYRERTQKELEGDVSLSFSTRVLNSYELDPRELTVLVSTDFSGNYIYDDVTAADWINISDKFVYPQVETGGLTNAGTISIVDLFVPGKPFYIAYRYQTIGRPPAARDGRNWRVEQFSLVNEYAAGSTVLADQTTAGWSAVNQDNVDPGRGVTISSARLNFRSNNVRREIGLDVWVVSQPIDLFKVDPDRGVAIKNMSENQLTSYTHMYDTPGTYEAVFVAANSTIYGEQSVTRTVSVTVEP
ncbi:DUF5017 domain-containing protein [Parapedobacter defluvii]|uniref:DUF5017 domain-containing protein n=1 Tax=Parapedobacter defluvii TaxID=2045106 RepID=UPI003342E06F